MPQSHEPPPTDAATQERRAELQTVLAAWHAATVRLEQTHEALRSEVGRLTDELEIKNRELARKNRLADLGLMASHVAHEVRNSLVPVNLYLSLLERRLADDLGSREILDKILGGFAALDVTVNDLLHFTSEREPQLQRFALSRLVDDLLGALAPQLAAQSIEAVGHAPPSLWVTADYHMLRRGLLNLALNAIDAMPAGGRLSICGRADADGVEIEVGDSGPGLNDEALTRAFEPFFTTKRNGTGLGLAIVARIAEVHGGEAAAGNAEHGGALFSLRLPHIALEAAA
jgi:signal transduction histidine kinase